MPKLKVCECCQRGYTDAAWQHLPKRGQQVVPSLEGEFGFILDLRNCFCGNTLAVEVKLRALCAACIASASTDGGSFRQLDNNNKESDMPAISYNVWGQRKKGWPKHELLASALSAEDAAAVVAEYQQLYGAMWTIWIDGGKP